MGYFFYLFLDNNRAQIIVLEDLAALRRAYKNYQLLMAPKLTTCDVFGMLLKYWLSTEG